MRKTIMHIQFQQRGGLRPNKNSWLRSTDERSDAIRTEMYEDDETDDQVKAASPREANRRPH